MDNERKTKDELIEYLVERVTTLENRLQALENDRAIQTKPLLNHDEAANLLGYTASSWYKILSREFLKPRKPIPFAVDAGGKCQRLYDRVKLIEWYRARKQGRPKKDGRGRKAYKPVY